MPSLFTVGHSTHSWDHFLGLLRRHHIQVVADVRSSPYSRRFAHFNRNVMEHALRMAGLRYVFLGEELGARRVERDCYVGGVAVYERIARTPAFAAGLARVQNGFQTFRVTLLCAEKDPLECHRAILVCRHLREAADIQHILADGSLEPQAEAEARLMSEENVPAHDFFTDHHKLVLLAYERRGDKIAYREYSDAASPLEYHG